MNEKNHGEHHHIKHKNPDTIKINKLVIWKSISAILGILLIFAVFTGGFGVGKGSNVDVKQAQAAQPRQEAPSAPSTDMSALIDDDTIKGDANAPVTIVEWSDFECPFCTRFYKETLWQIEENYIKTGKVKFVYRDFPLSFHANAQKAAEAAECADDQGNFWEMHDLLFENGVSRGTSSFKQYAADLGLDTASFNECLDSGKYASEVQKDFQDGQIAGITGTPGFIINGILVSGAQPFEVFQQIIESELAK